MKQISKQDIQVQEIKREDFIHLHRYFFESPAEYLNSIGLKFPMPGEAEKFQKKWEQLFSDRDKSGLPIPVLTVLYKDRPMGFHPSTHQIPGESLIMHAHFFNSELRGMGIGTVSYVLAIEKFLTFYGYKEVIFKTPKQNAAPIKIKEKLGLVASGEEVIDWPALVRPLQVTVFRVNLSDIAILKSRVGLV